ncbi:spectrin alpha chain, non-erythrocytic 1 [Trichonephila clavipes]|nr:spectrin alpha chain, non-erythrocytic 1 [Trichonephila clavipes]
MMCIPLAAKHCVRRRKGDAEHQDWMQNDGSQALFTDESRFSLEYDTRRVLARREKGAQNNPILVPKRSHYRQSGLMDSMSSVEALIRKHENFEEMCFTNFEKIQEIEMMARDLKDHEDFEVIQTRCEEICRRRDALQEASQRRKFILQDAKALQQLLLEMYEISNWMSEKIRVASDDSYKDLTNLLSKTQKHAAFEAEILANHSRVVDFTKQAEKLLEEKHFASVEIQEHIQGLENLWEDLMNATNLKKDRLRDAYDALQFKHKLDDVNSWLEETEAQIESEEYGSSVDALLLEINKVQEFEKEAEEYSQNLRILNDIADEFQQRNHFSKDEIISQVKKTTQRYHYIEDTLQKKESILQESLLLTRLENDIDDELSWIEENIKICETDQRYNDLMSVQAFQKKLQALETEIASREPLISSVVERGQRLNNDASAIKVEHLEERFQYLKDTISLRRLRLADALEAQKYYFEATQAEMWMKEKLSQVVGADAERVIYSVQAIQKKLSAVEAATDGFRQTIHMLQELSCSLIERGHYDAQTIQKKQEEVNDLYEELRQNTLKKSAIFREKEDYFVFERDIKSITSQLKAMSSVSTSTDHGRDVEHVEVAPELQCRMRTSIYSAVTAKRNRRSTASDLSRQLSSANGTTVSRQTVYRRLGHIGLYARRPVRCVPLTATHCRLRLTWSRQHALWTTQQWSCVMFSDESRFSLQSDSRRTLIWRAPGTRYHHYDGAGWLVWGGIILGSRTVLHVQSVTMTGHLYRDVILEQHVRLFRGSMGAEFLFMDDNARPHRANIVDECLQSEDITRMDWPAYSPDLNPIEHVWDMLGRLMAARQPTPTYLLELRRALLDEWCNIPQDQIDNLILSIPRRCTACIASSELLQKFEVFGNRLRNYENSILTLQDRGNTLIQEGHTEAENVEDLLNDLQTTWIKVKESADSRRQVLEQEKSVHAFYKSVDETISWIYEKDVALSSDDYGKDLESIKTLLRHHDTLEGDLKAIEEQVQAISEEAVVLSNQFPESKEDIETKQLTVVTFWKKCVEKAADRKDKLQQAEQMQSYFDEARDFQ